MYPPARRAASGKGRSSDAGTPRKVRQSSSTTSTVRAASSGDSLACNFFGARFEMATDTEQRYLSAMPSLGEGPYPVAGVAQAYGASDRSQVLTNRDSQN